MDTGPAGSFAAPVVVNLKKIRTRKRVNRNETDFEDDTETETEQIKDQLDEIKSLKKANQLLITLVRKTESSLKKAIKSIDLKEENIKTLTNK